MFYKKSDQGGLESITRTDRIDGYYWAAGMRPVAKATCKDADALFSTGQEHQLASIAKPATGHRRRVFIRIKKGKIFFADFDDMCISGKGPDLFSPLLQVGLDIQANIGIKRNQ
ncbi:MAG: hypothetical protein A2002_09715 [Pseudomonadales bacterium GWC1_66_9]|nr:MAG: hypothetical protein A2002_09715 [Pseudomonadales bacterium GWC1_66_9]